MKPMKTAVAAACLLAGASLAGPANAQFTFSSGANVAAIPEDAVDAATAMEENLTANSTGVSNAMENTPNTPAAQNVPAANAMQSSGSAGSTTNLSATGQANATINTAGTPSQNNAAPVSAIATTSTAANTTPVSAIPEPDTYALMAAGLGLIAYIGRRCCRGCKSA